MIITINGEKKEFQSINTVSDLLSEIGIDARKIAVERNMHIVKRGTYEETQVRDGDEFEIINFVGGG